MNLNDYSLWTAIVTPLHDNNEIDWESFARILKEQEEAGNGVLILGSTGEALNLEELEKIEVLQFTKKQNLKVPVMVGVGGSQIKSTLSWIDKINEMKFDAALLVTPLYAKPNDQGQFEWFKTLLDHLEVPAMLYNVPSRTGKELSFDAVRRLSGHEKFWAIKEASGSVEKFKEYKKAAGDRLVFSGDDALCPQFCAEGGSGLVSVASNAWPKETNLYVKKCLDQSLSKEDSSLWDACSSALFCVSNPIPVKRLMFENKQISSPEMRLPLSRKDLSQAATVLEASIRIEEWFKTQKDK